MRGFAERHRSLLARKQAHRQWFPRALVVVLAGIVCLAIAGCGAPTAPQLKLPGGTFTSTEYGFHFTYPPKWQVSSSGTTPSADGTPMPIPFSVIITHLSDSNSAVALVSTCAITVMNMKSSAIATPAAQLATNKTLKAMTIGGAPGYVGPPQVQDIPNSSVSVTHTDYYVVHGGYEYQISTDSVKGDNADADLQSIVTSFGFDG